MSEKTRKAKITHERALYEQTVMRRRPEIEKLFFS